MKCRWIFTARYVFDTDDTFTYEMQYTAVTLSTFVQ